MAVSFNPPLYETSYDLSKALFQGTVVDTSDPKKKNRVRVKVDTMTDSIDDNSLPWYAILAPAGQGNNSVSNVPSIGSRVLVQFPDGDVYNGIVSYALPQKAST